MKLKRYDHWESENCMKPHQQGEYVKFQDIERLEREAKYGRALLWAVETGVGVADHYGDEVHMDQGDLDELMNDYERYGWEYENRTD